MSGVFLGLQNALQCSGLGSLTPVKPGARPAPCSSAASSAGVRLALTLLLRRSSAGVLAPSAAAAAPSVPAGASTLRRLAAGTLVAAGQAQSR